MQPHSILSFLFREREQRQRTEGRSARSPSLFSLSLSYPLIGVGEREREEREGRARAEDCPAEPALHLRPALGSAVLVWYNYNEGKAPAEPDPPEEAHRDSDPSSN